jgi:hypothetical protein
MKKIMIAFAMIPLIFAFCHAESVNTAPYLGTWIEKKEGRAPDFTIEILHIAADHQAYFIHQAFNRGAATYSVKKAGTWQESAEGIDVIFDENQFNNLSLVYEVPGLITVINKGTGAKKYFSADASDMLSKMAEEKLKNVPAPSPTLAPENPLPDGMRVPMGEYLIGEFIPAGNYRVTLTGNDLAVIWVYKKGAYSGQYYSLVYSKGETVANVRLADGDTFKVEHATVILSEMKGL